MVETDAPYLAPGKFRGKRNEPSYVVETAKVLAETRGVSLEEISRQTTENFFRLFSKVPVRGSDRMTLTPDHPRLRLLGRRSAPGAGLGRLRSQQSEKPPPPLLAAGRAGVGSWRHPDRDRHLARSARAVDRRRSRSHRRGVPDPRARRPDPWHRRSALGGTASAPAHSGIPEPVDRRATSCCGFPIVS